MENSSNDTITVTIPQALRGLLTAFLIAGGGGVSYLFASGGASFNSGCDNCKELAIKISTLESRLNVIEAAANDNTRARWQVLNTRWSFKDQQLWVDELHARNKELDIPNPKNGNK